MFPSLNSRNLSSGLAHRTLKNLDFIKNAYAADVHPVTQVINSLLGLLVFPVEKEKSFFEKLEHEKLDSLDPAAIQAALITRFSTPSLVVTKFGNCKDFGKFFERLRNAISHRRLRFSGADPDSNVLKDVMITLQDCKYDFSKKKCLPPDWEIRLSAEDLEKLSRYLAEEIIKQGL
jgi:hypothetical protein